MSRIALVGLGVQVASVATSQAATLPNGVCTGDLMLMVIGAKPSGTAGTADAVTITGWTQQGSPQRQEIGTDDVSVQLWYKIATAPESNPTVNVGTAWSGTEGYTLQVFAFRGVDQTTPFDVASVGSGGAAAATFTPTGVTTVTNNAVAISAVVTADDNALNFNTSQSFSLIASGANFDTVTGTDHAVGVACKEITSAGAVTMPTWNESAVGNDAWCALSTALRPDTTTWTLEDTWMAAEAAVWSAGIWGLDNTTAASATSVAAAGRQASGTNGSYTGHSFAETSDGAFPDDFELWIDYTHLTNSEHYAQLRMRSNGDTDYYCVEIGADYLAAGERVADVEVTNYIDDAPTLTVGGVVHMRVRMVGTSVKFRYWQDNAAEPGTWNATGTGSRTTGSLELQVLGGAAASSVSADWRALRVTTASDGVSANLGTASVTVTANNPSGTRNAGTATIATTTPTPGSADVLGTATAVLTANLAGTGHSPLVALATLVANLLGYTDAATVTAAAVAIASANLATGVTPAAATASLTASNLTSIVRTALAATATTIANNPSGARTPTTATASLAASNLTASSPSGIALGTGTVAVAASNLSGTRTPTAANATITANPVTQTRTAVLVAATVTATGLDFDAVALGAEPLGSGRTAAAAAATVTASPVAYTDAVTLLQAAVSLVAAPTGRSSAETAATATTTAFGPGVGATIAAANISLLARNLATTLNLGTATATVTAYNLTPPATLASASVTVTAGNLSLTPTSALSPAAASFTAVQLAVAETTIAATAALTGSPLASALTQRPASVDVAASPLTQTRIALFGQANVTAIAYDLANQAPGTAPLAPATVAVTAFGLGPFTLVSALTATTVLTATTLAGPDRTQAATTAAATAYTLTNTDRRASTAVQVDITGNNLQGAHTPTTAAGTAVATAYNLVAAGLTVRLRGKVVANVRTNTIEADVRQPAPIMAMRVGVHA